MYTFLALVAPARQDLSEKELLFLHSFLFSEGLCVRMLLSPPSSTHGKHLAHGRYSVNAVHFQIMNTEQILLPTAPSSVTAGLLITITDDDTWALLIT